MSPEHIELKPKDYVCKMNGKVLTQVSCSLRVVSPGKIRVYVSYPNGRVYSNVPSRSGSIRFNPSLLEWEYTWRGQYEVDGVSGYSSRYRVLHFKFKMYSSKMFKQVQDMF
jgi:hypothetical protein